MIDPRSPLAVSRGELPEEEASREQRHQQLATLLAAFADGELPSETASQIDAHLLGCARCRRELVVHRTLRLRLEEEPVVVAPQSLRDRITAAIAAAPAPQFSPVAARTTEQTPDASVTVVEAPRQRRLPRLLIGAVAGVVGITLLAAAGRWIRQRNAAPPATVVSAASLPLMSAALADYRRVTRGDLPGRARDLASVRDAMPFPVHPLESPSLRLVAAWTTSLNGEPAAVLAYRWNDHVLLQYLVSDSELYRPAEARGTFAAGRVLAAHDGDQSIVVWPEATGGSLIIGEVPVDRLTQMRTTR